MALLCSLLTVALLLVSQPTLGTTDGLSRTPALGWNSWNWVGVNRFGPNCPAKLGCHSDAVMREMADAMVSSGLRDAGYEFINLSEGWPMGPNLRFPNGTIRWDPERYPFGIQALADYIHSKGLKFGIYLDAGNYTCAGFPGSFGHEERDVADIASWGADYLWLDGCGLPFFSKARGGNPPLVQEKYELWSRLLRSSGRKIVFQASWPDYVEDGRNHATAGSLPSNIDLWYKVGTQAHEFRFYSDVTPNWNAILDIANTAHEWQMNRFHRPGSWAFMDMLEIGVTDTNGSMFLSFEESRSHFALWVLMAQPLHLGLDIRNISAELLNVVANEEVLALHADPLGKMGARVKMSDGRLNGTQVWSRELSDGSRMIGLLNLGGGANASLADNCTWEKKAGGYFQSGPRGNFACYKDATVPEMKASCCAAGLKQCVGFNTPSATHIGGCAKRDSAGGWLNATGEDDFIITKGHDDPVPPPPRRICVAWGDVGLNPHESMFVRELWQRKSLGLFAEEFCIDVKGHDTVLLHVDSKSCGPTVASKSDERDRSTGF